LPPASSRRWSTASSTDKARAGRSERRAWSWPAGSPPMLGRVRARATGGGAWPPLFGAAGLAVHRQCGNDRLGGAERLRPGWSTAGRPGAGALAAGSGG
jgi:hypothetical protein